MTVSKPIIKRYGTGKPEVVIVGSLHGDELVGSRVIQAIEEYPLQKGTLITIIGNPDAIYQKKRFIEEDLNRCFPGKRQGTHEQKLAHDITPFIRHADYCIDIHSTTTNTRRAVIIKKKTKEIKKLLSLFKPEHVVIMPKGIGDGSLINFCKAGISLEYGTHKSRETYKESLRDASIILKKLGMIDSKIEPSKRTTQYYAVYGTEPKPRGFQMKRSIMNFYAIKKGEVLGTLNGRKVLSQEAFYPILFGARAYKDIMGFKAKKEKGL